MTFNKSRVVQKETDLRWIGDGSWKCKKKLI